MASNHYRGVIWTNHALSRLTERGISQDYALKAFNTPDQTAEGREPGTTQYSKRFGNALITVVAKQNDKNEWLILSCWIDPPLRGSIDEKRRKGYQSYQKASFWMKVWITVKRQLGLSKY